ncbi:MAG: hypothetical protein N2Z72_05940 [Bacteroidales bacterium]|nr:hypothetical protein [Bacteroidales bacterium]
MKYKLCFILTFLMIFFLEATCQFQCVGFSYGRGKYTFGFPNIKNDMEFFNYLYPELEKPFKYHRFYENYSIKTGALFDEDDDFSPLVVVYLKHQRSVFYAKGQSHALYDHTNSHIYDITAKYSIYYTSLGLNIYLCLIPHVFYFGLAGIELAHLTQKFTQTVKKGGITPYENITKTQREIQGWEFSLLLQVPLKEKPLLQIKPYVSMEPFTSLLSVDMAHFYNRYNHVGIDVTFCIPL